MQILIYKWDIYPYEDIINTLKEQGHSVDVPALSAKNHLEDTDFELALSAKLQKKSYDFVFSVNYFANIARVCHKYHVTYVSWTVDSPMISLLTPTIFYPENCIFIFDKAEYEQIRKRGVKQAYYLPLAGSTHRYTSSRDENKSIEYYPVSFLGNLYDKNYYDAFCSLLPDYLCGYIDAAIEAQLNIPYGNIFPYLLTDNIFQDLKPYLHLDSSFLSCFDTEEEELLNVQFSTRVLCHKTASLVRIRTLNELSKEFDVHIFTTSDTSPLRQVQIHPPADYHTDMSQVFAHSKINLNMTSPNIESGIPLRVWDILSAGGFLLTDYRPEYDGLLENGRELVIYENLRDLKQKVAYYLTHEEERLQIAQNGYKRILQKHNYTERIQDILAQISIMEE